MNLALINQYADEIAAIVKAEDWRLLKSYFHHVKSIEEKEIKGILWCRCFLPHYFSDPTPPFHYELSQIYFRDGNDYTAAPRGFSKTSLCQGLTACSIANGWETFIVVIEKTFNEAAEIISAIREEFSENPLLKAVYGETVAKNAYGEDPDKAKDAQGDVLINGVRLRAKGFNAPIRGLKWKEHRPSLILLDDVEEDDHVRNEDQRRKYLENYTQGIVPALSLDGRIKVFGTILHQDSLLKNLIEQHKGRIYSAFDPSAGIEDKARVEASLLWPERWTYDRLKKKYEDMLTDGLGSSKFSQEYLNVPLDDDSRIFKFEWLQKTFKREELKLRALNRSAVFDPAESKNEGSDWTFLTVVDWDSENNWFVEHVERRKVDSAELISWIFEVWNAFHPGVIGVGKKAFEFQIQPWLKARAEQDGVYPNVVEIKEPPTASKTDRVKGNLQGRFEAGKIYFKAEPKDHTNILKGELYDFPKGKNDDGCDSLSGHQMIGSRPFSPNKEQPSTLQGEIDAYFKGKRKGIARRI